MVNISCECDECYMTFYLFFFIIFLFLLFFLFYYFLLFNFYMTLLIQSKADYSSDRAIISILNISGSDWVRYLCPDQINYQVFSGFQRATSRTWKRALFHIPCYPELTITLTNNAVWYISRIELIDRTRE